MIGVLYLFMFCFSNHWLSKLLLVCLQMVVAQFPLCCQCSSFSNLVCSVLPKWDRTVERSAPSILVASYFIFPVSVLHAVAEFPNT